MQVLKKFLNIVEQSITSKTNKHMKKSILLLAIILGMVTSSYANGPGYVYNGPAKCQVMNSETGTLTVNALAIAYGYTVINSGSGYATLLKDGRYYEVSRIEVNRRGLVVFVRVELVK